MTVTSVSSKSVTANLTQALQKEQSTLTILAEQLASHKKHTDLTDYDPGDARNIINIQSSAMQREAYISVITTVNNALSVYDTTLTDLESVCTQAQKMVNNNPTYSESIAENVYTQCTSYLKSVTVDLNQQINGRYIYSGSRYTTLPVQDCSSLDNSTLSPTIYLNNSTVPAYDTSATLYETRSGQTVTIAGSVGSNQVASMTVDGTAYTYTIQAGDTLQDVADGLAASLTSGGVTFTQAGTALTIDAGSTIDALGVTTTSTTAYVKDRATIDAGYDVTYGLTSNDPTFQKLILGLRYMQAAGQTSNATDYQQYMQQASTLLNEAMTSLQTMHTTVANNMNTMTSEKANQKAAISRLTDQISDIRNVDVTQVSTEITSLETILQASYAVTGNLLKMSIVNYL